MWPPKPRCGFCPACVMTVSVQVPTIRTGMPSCGLSLWRNGQVLSRLNIFGIHACAEPELEASAQTSAKQIAFMVLYLVLIVLPVIGLLTYLIANSWLSSRYLPLAEGISSGGAKYLTGFTP